MRRCTPTRPQRPPTRWRPRTPTSLTAAVLRIHAARAGTAKREVRLLSRFTGANPHVSIVGVPSLPFDVSDLEALRAIADQITGEAIARRSAARRRCDVCAGRRRSRPRRPPRGAA